MTNIEYKKTKESFVLEAKGHADYAEHGKDIVCSAISVLLETLIQYCLLNAIANYRIDNGYIYLEVNGEEGVRALDVVVLGLENLAREYPNNVNLEGVFYSSVDIFDIKDS